MADWTNLPNAAVGVGGLPSGTTVTALRDNPVAIAEGAAGAPRVVGDALNLRIAAVDPRGMASVVFTDLEPASFLLEFQTIQPDSSSNRALIIAASFDNGNSFTSDRRISESNNFQLVGGAGGFLGGLSGILNNQNNVARYFTGAPRDDGLLSFLENSALTLIRFKPFQPPNAIRIGWSLGSFRDADHQKIILYQGGNRPFGGKL